MREFSSQGWWTWFSRNKCIQEFGRVDFLQGGDGSSKDIEEDIEQKRLTIDSDSKAIKQARVRAQNNLEHCYSRFIAGFPSEIFAAVELCPEAKLEEDCYKCDLRDSDGVIFLLSRLNNPAWCIETSERSYRFQVPGILYTIFRFTDSGFKLEAIQTNSSLFEGILMGVVASNRSHFYFRLHQAIKNLERAHYSEEQILGFINSMVSLYEYNPGIRYALTSGLDEFKEYAHTRGAKIEQAIKFFGYADQLASVCRQESSPIRAGNAKLLLAEAISVSRLLDGSMGSLGKVLRQTRLFLQNSPQRLFACHKQMSAFFSKQFSWSKRLSGYVLALMGVGLLVCALGLSLFSLNVLPAFTIYSVILSVNSLTQGLTIAVGAAGLLLTCSGFSLYNHHIAPDEFITSLGYKR